MKTNKKRLTVSLLAAVTVLALVLTGCGAENAADHNKYLKDEVVSSQQDKDSSKDADKKDTSDKDKKDSEKDSKTADKADKKDSGKQDSSKPSAGNSGGGSSSKPSGGNGGGSSNAGSGNSGSSKPSGGTGGGSSEPVHHCSFTTVVSSTAGDCSHQGTVTKRCSCGRTKTENTGFGSHKRAHKDAQGEYQNVVVGYEGWYVCKKCGFETQNVEAMGGHIFECDSTYRAEERPITKPQWVETSPAYDYCSICNTRL